MTYWLELARRALLGDKVSRFPTLGQFSDAQLLGILGVFTLALLITSSLFFERMLHVAREKGMIDMETSY